MCGKYIGVDAVERFYKFVRKEESCWIWTGNLSKTTNRGRFWIKKKRHYAYRASYLLFKGEIGDKFVLHTCDNTSCVNPDHLFLGYQKDNVLDCINKKRNAVGEGSNSNKLVLEEVKEIRRINKLRYFERDELARMYNVSRACIIKILNNKSWKHAY